MWRRRPANQLTRREREVLDLIRCGLTNEEIALHLDISTAGAKYHVSEILSKLGVATREQAADLSLEKRPRWRAGWPLWASLGSAATVAVALAATVALGSVGVDSGRDEEGAHEPQTALDQCDWNQYEEPNDVPLTVFERCGVDFLFPNTLEKWCAWEVIEDRTVVRSWPSENGRCRDPWGVLPEGQLASITITQGYSCGATLTDGNGDSHDMEPIHPAECDELWQGTEIFAPADP
jgi:DNA-binding CsgD family transcriptional regulator